MNNLLGYGDDVRICIKPYKESNGVRLGVYKKQLVMVEQLRELIFNLGQAWTLVNIKGEQLMSTLTPAYGRDYKSQKEVLADFNGGKDFIFNDITSLDDGRYVTKTGLERTSVRSVQIRYGKLRKVMVVNL